ncbi:NlpC/P60 family protein [Chitinophaga sp. CF118]|uniref:C40 family peptidase n=1 Tax=Chitinophaga sp. CF118 TaxID=1884367 RepID=UPI0008F2FDB5|nr:C40 family peptidase [Chitinophaga sp. CF118]SFD52214.1 NlpC/P60 family protein [Chitinophaga sp. CF118]
MPYAITVVPIMPLRAEPAHRSEMISQVLWGENVEIIVTGSDGWVKVKCQFDGYEGWGTFNHLEIIDEKLFLAPYTHYTASWVNTVKINEKTMHVPFGCIVKQVVEPVTIWGNNIPVKFEGTLKECPGNGSKVDKKDLLEKAFLFLNTPYLWGGKSVFGADCSGFTQTVFKTLGIPLLRDAYQQATQGETVDFLQEVQTGDLAFFDNAEGRITHVGILLNDHEIIHASGKVRVDPIDNQGIINADTGLRTHQLRIIKRYF